MMSIKVSTHRIFFHDINRRFVLVVSTFGRLKISKVKMYKDAPRIVGSAQG